MSEDLFPIFPCLLSSPTIARSSTTLLASMCDDELMSSHSARIQECQPSVSPMKSSN